MKSALLFSAILSLAACHLPAATPPEPTPVSTLTMIACNPTFADDGTLLLAPVQAVFQNVITSAGEKFTAQQNLTWDGADKKKTVTIDGIKLTYDQVTRAAAAIANQEKAALAAAAAANKAAGPSGSMPAKAKPAP